MEDKKVIILENVPIEFTTNTPHTRIIGEQVYRHHAVAEKLYLYPQKEEHKE